MNDCTVLDVLTGAMSLVGDPDGEITQELMDDFGTAYSNMMALAVKLRLPAIQREVYYTLPADTGVLFPSQLGVNDFAEPVRIWERGGVTTTAIADTADGSPITVRTSTAHGRSTNDRVELNGVNGVPGYVNRDWFITVTDSTHFRLNGSIAGGSNGTGGTVMYSLGRFIEVLPADAIPSYQPPGQTLGGYKWQSGALWFPGSSEARQLWIEYLANENPPISGVIGFANGRELNFMKHATAAHFCPKRQIPQGPQLKMDAYGSSGEPDGGGGLLRTLVNPMYLQRQGRSQEPQRYRARRGMLPTYR